MDFYNFFSFSAKKAIYRASEICGQFNNQYLEPEHVLYSLLNLRSCSAMQVLHTLGINLPKFTYPVEAYLYEHAGSFKGNAVFSQRTITLLDASYKEVKRLHHREIGTTHLLIGLAQDRSAFLHNLFEEHGLDTKKIRDSFLMHLKDYNQGTEAQQKLAAARPGADVQEPQRIPKVNYDSVVHAAVRSAFHAAEALGQREVGCAHIMYALLTQALELWPLLQLAGIDPDGVTTVLAQQFVKTEQKLATRAAVLSWPACDLLGQAYALALHQRHNMITAWILLLALCRSSDEQVQGAFGSAEVVQKLVQMLEAGPQAQSQPEQVQPPEPHPLPEALAAPLAEMFGTVTEESNAGQPPEVPEKQTL